MIPNGFLTTIFTNSNYFICDRAFLSGCYPICMHTHTQKMRCQCRHLISQSQLKSYRKVNCNNNSNARVSTSEAKKCAYTHNINHEQKLAASWQKGG